MSQRSIIRLGILLLLFDVYLTWARIEKSAYATSSFLSRAPIIVQYLFFLSLNALATLAHHLTVRSLASILAPKPRASAGSDHGNGSVYELPSNPTTPVFPNFFTNPQSQQSSNPASPSKAPPTSTNDPSLNGAGASSPYLTSENHISPNPTPLRRTPTGPVQNIEPLPPPSPASPTAISTALLVSSCAKLFPILLVIWGSDGSGSTSDTYAEGSTETISPAHTILVQQALHGITPVETTAVSTPIPQRVSESALEAWAAKLVSSFPESTPKNYLGELFSLSSSLLSLSAMDTHLVLLSNVESLYILLGCGYLRAVALAASGHAARWAVQRLVLGSVGLVN